MSERLVAASLVMVLVTQLGCGDVAGDAGRPTPTRTGLSPPPPARSLPDLSGTRLRPNPLHEVVLRDNRLEVAYITSRSSRLHSVQLRRTPTGLRVGVTVRAYRVEDRAATYRCVYVPLRRGPGRGNVVDAASGEPVPVIEQLAPERCPTRRPG